MVRTLTVLLKKEKEEYVDSGFMAPGKFIATFFTEMIC